MAQIGIGSVRFPGYAANELKGVIGEVSNPDASLNADPMHISETSNPIQHGSLSTGPFSQGFQW
jgi:hypothetical protein